MIIKTTDFGKRHFDKTFRGTKITNISQIQFDDIINSMNLSVALKDNSRTFSKYKNEVLLYKVMEGYAPFCKLVAVKNFTDAKVGTTEITIANHQYLRSSYKRRNINELEVLSRWLELPIKPPIAEWLILVLYDKDQIDEEGLNDIGYVEFSGDYGIVAILGQASPDEEPMKPETMIRNSLGISEGGSGFPINKEQYKKSVTFWNKNATLS